VLKDKSGQVTGALSSARDITERKQAEKDLLESEERYRALFDRSLDLIYLIDFEGRFIDANDAALNRFGYTKEEIHSLNFASLLNEDQLLLAFKELQNIRETGIHKSMMELRLRHKDGSDVYVETRGSTVMSNGTPVAIQAIARDITERRRAEESLREREEKYRLIAENMTDVISIVDMNMCSTFVSPSILRLRGFTVEEAMEQSLEQIMTPESLLLAYRTYEEEMQLESSGTADPNRFRIIEFEEYRKDMSTIWVEATLSFLRDADGRPIGMLSMTRNINARKQAEEELQQSFEKLRKSLGATVNAISLTVEMKDPYTSGHQQRVSDLSRAIATEMGLSADRQDFVRTASSIHDIGKIALPAEILSKPTKLTELEFSLIKTHAQIGYDILKDIEFPWPVADVVLQHHERMNGSGYPQGLKGENILLEARILAIADVVEAIASHRPYRPALGIDLAMEDISGNKGILYDADAVDACLRLFREKSYKWFRKD
jgi:PAS domain S-box-containing protein